MKKIFFCFILIFFILNSISYGNEISLKPEKTIKITDYAPYASPMYYLPGKDLFIFGIKNGFIVFDRSGKLIKKYTPHSQSPGWIATAYNFLSTKNFYYVVGMFKIIKLDKNFNFIDEFGKSGSCGGAVNWINHDESFYCLTTFAGLEYHQKSGIIIKRNKELINRISENNLSHLFNAYITWINYPNLYAINEGNLQFYTIDLRSLSIKNSIKLPKPSNFSSSFENDKKIDIGKDIKKYFEETSGYGRVLALKIDHKIICVVWELSGTGKKYLTLYSLPEKRILTQIKLEKNVETTYQKGTFHPFKPIFYDYDYIENEEENDYGLIKVYNFKKIIRSFINAK